MKRAVFVLPVLLVLAGCLWRQPVLPADRPSTGMLPTAGRQGEKPHSTPAGVYSMGVPSRFEFHLSPMLSYSPTDRDRHLGGLLGAGLYRHLLNPIYGVGLTGEGYLGGAGGDFDSGVRLLGALRLFFLQLGVDYSFRLDRVDPILSFNLPLKRGGLLGMGDGFRIDWIPSRDHSAFIGYTIPIGRRHLGKTRPEKARTELPAGPARPERTLRDRPAAGLEPILDRILHAAEWINRYTTPFFDQPPSGGAGGLELERFRRQVVSFKEHINRVDERYPGGHTFNAELAAYHRGIEEAVSFLIETPGRPHPESPQVRRVTGELRKILLREVIAPYNRLLGSSKKNDSLYGYGSAAGAVFRWWLDRETPFDRGRKDDLVSLLADLIEIIEENRAHSLKTWGDSRMVWIPLHFGLHPADCDSQEKMDAVLEMLTGRRFVDGNTAAYVLNEQFLIETARSIHRAEDYHVLWIHDYRGINSGGDPDEIGYHMTLSYLDAMVQRLKDYDRTGRFPTYMIFIDQFYFEKTIGRLWLGLLENPLQHELRLPPGSEGMECGVRNAQEALRAAVRASARLQEEKRRLGEGEIFKKIKVHVNVTNPSDFSFRSRHILDSFPIMSDNMMRDHRKVVFYDVTELDPARGGALLGGLGIGEHYAGPGWEDRSLLVHGPLLLSLKEAARRLLLQQGFDEGEIPEALLPLPVPPGYDALVRARMQEGWKTKMMDNQNETGFYEKNLNALKGALYSLMPPGSTVIVPDSLWNSPFWGGMLVGAALRGCRILLIAPSLENAPSDSFPEMSRVFELFERLLWIRSALAGELAAAGGALHLGMYTRKSGVGDVAAKLDHFKEGVGTYPFLGEIFPFDENVYASMEETNRNLKRQAFRPSYSIDRNDGQVPKLHLKTDFLASPLLRRLMTHPAWGEAMRDYLAYRAAGEAGSPRMDALDAADEARDRFTERMLPIWESLPESERQRLIVYLTVGSANQSYRSMLMDGEVAVVVSGYQGLAALLDLFFMSGLSTWIQDAAELERLLPPERGWKRWLGRLIKKAL